MPRGKFLNHKGRSRQFTPVEELQREQELEGCLLQQASDGSNVDESLSSVDEAVFEGPTCSENYENNDIENVINTKAKKMGGAVEGLIEISNPNRPLKKSLKFALLTKEVARGKIVEDPLIEKRRRDRAKEKPRFSSSQKTSIEANADLARLALVRKKREAAAEQRLAAKKDNSSEPTPSSSKSDISLKKKTNSNKNNKSSGNGSNNDYGKKDENLSSKVVKGQRNNGNKRNVSMQA